MSPCVMPQKFGNSTSENPVTAIPLQPTQQGTVAAGTCGNGIAGIANGDICCPLR
jgi:hypothetical protein